MQSHTLEPAMALPTWLQPPKPTAWTSLSVPRNHSRDRQYLIFKPAHNTTWALQGGLSLFSILNSLPETSRLSMSQTGSLKGIWKCNQRLKLVLVWAVPPAEEVLLGPRQETDLPCNKNLEGAFDGRLCNSKGLRFSGTSMAENLWEAGSPRGISILVWNTLFINFKKSYSGVRAHPISEACRNTCTPKSLGFWKG